MIDEDIFAKYRLSGRGLGQVLQTLLDMKALTVEDLYERCPSLDEVLSESWSALPKHYIALPVAIYDKKRPEIRGMLREVSDKGLGITGIKARAGETLVFAVPTEGPTGVTTIEFEVQCRWFESGTTEKEPCAGFQVTKISDESLEHLRELIRSSCLEG